MNFDRDDGMVFQMATSASVIIGKNRKEDRKGGKCRKEEVRWFNSLPFKDGRQTYNVAMRGNCTIQDLV